MLNTHVDEVKKKKKRVQKNFSTYSSTSCNDKVRPWPWLSLGPAFVHIKHGQVHHGVPEEFLSSEIHVPLHIWDLCHFGLTAIYLPHLTLRQILAPRADSYSLIYTDAVLHSSPFTCSLTWPTWRTAFLGRMLASRKHSCPNTRHV